MGVVHESLTWDSSTGRNRPPPIGRVDGKRLDVSALPPVATLEGIVVGPSEVTSGRTSFRTALHGLAIGQAVRFEVVESGALRIARNVLPLRPAMEQ